MDADPTTTPVTATSGLGMDGPVRRLLSVRRPTAPAIADAYGRFARRRRRSGHFPTPFRARSPRHRIISSPAPHVVPSRYRPDSDYPTRSIRHGRTERSAHHCIGRMSRSLENRLHTTRGPSRHTRGAPGRTVDQEPKIPPRLPRLPAGPGVGASATWTVCGRDAELLTPGPPVKAALI